MLTNFSSVFLKCFESGHPLEVGWGGRGGVHSSKNVILDCIFCQNISHRFEIHVFLIHMYKGRFYEKNVAVLLDFVQ